MSNPYFDRSPAFREGRGGTATATASRTPNGYPTMPGYEPGRGQAQEAYGQQYGSAPAYGQQAQPYGQQHGQQAPQLRAARASLFQHQHHAYGRDGQPCERCGTDIRKIVLGQRGTHFCPKCQKLRQ